MECTFVIGFHIMVEETCIQRTTTVKQVLCFSLPHLSSLLRYWLQSRQIVVITGPVGARLLLVV